ncbi:MAG TPA: GNAT family N-acetyltransferase [Candidatus Acidoferrales bacterium]
MFRIVPAFSEEDISQARNLFREYATTRGVLPCVQDFEREVSSLPGAYAPPTGRLLLAIHEGAENGAAAVGCGAIRKFQGGVCEMKRLYLRPAFRGDGTGRKLAEELVTEARSIGYARMVLDTLPTMDKAHKLYRSLGFHEIPAYWNNPIPGVLYFELKLH